VQKKEAYCASWIIPVDSPPMRDSALIAEDGRIVSILPIHELPRHSKNLKIFDFPNSVILPAWVNAHTHLELSFLKDETLPTSNFLGWVQALIERIAQKWDETAIKKAALEQMQHMRQMGTALAGDISNGALLPYLPYEPLRRIIFFEILGFQREKAETIWQSAWQKRNSQNPEAYVTPHAPFSTSAPLLEKINQHSDRLSIHLAESREEFAFFTRGSEAMVNFLQKRQVWPKNWQTPGKTPVQYVYDLNLLKPNTLIVHGVQVTDRDIGLIRQSGATVCLCPRSNERLNVGLPPVDRYLKKQVPLCLGTDSLASNTSLDLNDEIYYLWQRFQQELEARLLVRMATLNGARALGQDHEFGSLTVGKKAAFNVFQFRQPVNEHPELAVVSKKWSKLICF